ncbi:MAG: hypothetical protein IPP69_06725 [Flavobacteriales bacterium]|nr:hypothetical protein [Flavobacteriales bacterium]
MDPDLIRAVGVESQFDNTTEVNYQSYKAKWWTCLLQLTPKAWVKVKAVDIEPLNPEVLYVGALPPGGAMDLPIYLKVGWYGKLRVISRLCLAID